MTENVGKGDAGTVAEFDELQVEQEKQEKDKIAELMAHLKEKLQPADYAKAMTILDLKPEVDMAAVMGKLDEILTLAKKKKPEDEEIPCSDGQKDLAKKKDEYPEEKAKKKDEYPKPGEEKLADYKGFMAKCMKEGKSMKECADAYKKAYPEPPKKEEIAEVEKLAGELERETETQKQLKELRAEVDRMKEAERLTDVTAKIEGLISEKHLAPSSRETVVKLAAKLTPDLQTEYLNSFRGQKFRGFEDVGKQQSEAPGAAKLDEETKKRIMKAHGIDDLIEEKGLKRRAS